MKEIVSQWLKSLRKAALLLDCREEWDLLDSCFLVTDVDGTSTVEVDVIELCHGTRDLRGKLYMWKNSYSKHYIGSWYV